MSPSPPIPAVGLTGLWIGWSAAGAALLALAGTLLANRHRFDWALELADIPALPLAAGLVAAGAVFLAVLPLARASAHVGATAGRWLLGLVLAVGLALRLLMLAAEPALEDDQQRYLFEGAMVAHGLSPYRHAPADARAAPRDTPLGRLADASGPVIDRVNHPGLKTIYPPVAQGAFALAYYISPFSITAWRLLLLACDCATLWLILSLLADTGRSPLWSALYWWNPIVIKEVANSAHMEGVLMVLVMLAVWLAARRRMLPATGVLGLAAGVKIWPLLLVPLLLRPLAARPRLGLVALALLLALCLLWVAPIVAGGLDGRSGFLAYAERWQANSALLPALRGLIAKLLAALGAPIEPAGRVARAMLALAAGLSALWLARRPIAGTADLLERTAVVTLVLVLLSPAQFPWYMIWTLPFLPFAPRWSVAALAVTVPVYYTSFHFTAADAYSIFRDRIVWLIWLPIWGLLAGEAWQAWRGRRHIIESS